MPALTEMFNECFVPNCGISIVPLHIATAFCETPKTSLPKTTAYFLFVSILKSFRNTEFSTCSMA